MNPLTLVKRIKEINSKEAALGISEQASWHAKYKESAYVFVGGIAYDLTEGDILAVFAQYGEIVDVNLVRDKATGKSKGFCFIAYEDQRSTILAVDNLNGANVLGRIIRVDHVSNYKKKEEEDEEEEQRKREERGVCRAFQRGNCTYGAACKFSHNEQRSANTGWGAKEDEPRWEQDKYEGPPKRQKKSGNLDNLPKGVSSRIRSDDKNGRFSREEDNQMDKKFIDTRIEMNPRDQDKRGIEKSSERYEKGTIYKEWDRRATENRSRRHESELNKKEDHDDRGRQESRGRYDLEPKHRGDRDNRGKEERSGRNESETNPRGGRDNKGMEGGHGRHEPEPNPREDREYREKEGRLARHESNANKRDERYHREGEKRSRYDRDSDDSSYHHLRDENDANCRRSNR